MRIIFVSLAVIIIDQVSKLLVKGFSIPYLHLKITGMNYGESISVIGNFFRITFIENPGLAFGFDPGLDFKLWVSLFSLFASIALVIYLYIIRNKNFTTKLAVALILGGAVGNLIDRMFYGLFYGYAPLFYGKVVDFFDFDFIKFSLFGRNFDRWPIFNVADAAVTVGVLILILFYPKSKKESKNNAGETAATVQGTSINLNENNRDREPGTDLTDHRSEENKNAEPDYRKKIQDSNS